MNQSGKFIALTLKQKNSDEVINVSISDNYDSIFNQFIFKDTSINPVLVFELNNENMIKIGEIIDNKIHKILNQRS